MDVVEVTKEPKVIVKVDESWFRDDTDQYYVKNYIGEEAPYLDVFDSSNMPSEDIISIGATLLDSDSETTLTELLQKITGNTDIEWDDVSTYRELQELEKEYDLDIDLAYNISFCMARALDSANESGMYSAIYDGFVDACSEVGEILHPTYEKKLQLYLDDLKRNLEQHKVDIEDDALGVETIEYINDGDGLSFGINWNYFMPDPDEEVFNEALIDALHDEFEF
jgi:hypothetical protein